MSTMKEIDSTPSDIDNLQHGYLKLSYQDRRPATLGLGAINAVLLTAGVRISQVDIPKEAIPILKTSMYRKLSVEDHDELISLFPLHRGELLDEIEKAGRKPEMHRGGFMSTAEYGGTPYPKVVDIKAISADDLPAFQARLGKLHSNSSEDGVGIDEVMTIVSGGSSVWFFKLSDNSVGKLTLGAVDLGGKAWRISYPGLGIHGTYLNSENGILIAYAHGPRNFVVRYYDTSIDSSELLGTNPWLDFSGKTPILLE